MAFVVYCFTMVTIHLLSALRPATSSMLAGTPRNPCGWPKIPAPRNPGFCRKSANPNQGSGFNHRFISWCEMAPRNESMVSTPLVGNRRIRPFQGNQTFKAPEVAIGAALRFLQVFVPSSYRLLDTMPLPSAGCAAAGRPARAPFPGFFSFLCFGPKVSV